MSELPSEYSARKIAGNAVAIASVCSKHPEILRNVLHFLNSTFVQVFVRKVIERSAAVIKTTVLAMARAKVQSALPAYFFEGANG
ncbi:MAG: hypothetical protein ACPGZR_12640 [Paracoccaceae bacterium]|jgi:tagatose-1,6-bisphosphate aldolase non-catalytic subunit AgaZ/GatZ